MAFVSFCISVAYYVFQWVLCVFIFSVVSHQTRKYCRLFVTWFVIINQRKENQRILWFCRSMRRFFKKWLIWDLTETNWLNLLGTEYKIRFVIFIFTLSVPARLSLICLWISGYCNILFVIGQPVSCV